MFTKIRTCFRRIRDLFSYSRIFGQVQVWLNSYPGMENSTALRAWLRPIAMELTQLASKSTIQLDDRVTDAILRFIDHDHLWNILYESIQMMLEHVSDHQSNEITEVDRTPYDPSHQLVHTARLIRPENPMLVIAAAGLILQIVQLAQRYRQPNQNTYVRNYQ